MSDVLGGNIAGCVVLMKNSDVVSGGMTVVGGSSAMASSRLIMCFWFANISSNLAETKTMSAVGNKCGVNGGNGDGKGMDGKDGMVGVGIDGMIGDDD